MAVLIVIWFVTTAGYFWPGWVVLGWVPVLALHAWFALGQAPLTEAAVTQAQSTAS